MKMMSDLSYVGMNRCYFCQEFAGVLLKKNLAKTLPMDCGVVNLDPCNKCAEWMQKGIILISVRDGEDERVEKERKVKYAEYQRLKAHKSPTWRRNNPFVPTFWMPDPYRTGGWVVVSASWIENVMKEPMRSLVLETRWSFVPDEAWDMIGLPRPEKKELNA